MSKLNNRQMIFCLIVGIVIALSIFVMQRPKANQGYTPAGTVTLKCLSLLGDSIVTYTGNDSSITWYSDGTYVGLTLADRYMKIPQHRCEYTKFR
ncbi:putative membrane-bound inhibitor of lysozyme [Acinetobacter phage vB_AbaM_Kimel]|uniref:Putative membrane-bound inhibitor of lysozyme n=1 Tax=Acinetobacter phage vB_AbaM_Kimel TaxID=2686303 RepID=A0A6B9LZ06_9CAUD|nr:putative membrane-bound inhibitor of lysozyme [Acinetobacter phage vB_AbaM_Kimel]QHB48160.1 putative membrane-bound inhibitor of lysozyme [Acinetobacter phage vB_AbaM_Kimel]